MIEAEGVSKRLGGNWALMRTDLKVADSETVCVIGENGSGKTTLLKLLSGILRPTEGSVLIDGTSPRLLKHRIGYVGHESFLYPHLTVLENLRFWATLYSVDPAQSEALIESTGVAHRRDTAAGRLSRGGVQRVALARALLHDPDYLFLDEPFTGLDDDGVARAKQLLFARARTVVASAHSSERSFIDGREVFL